jgi:hypothetical protein
MLGKEVRGKEASGKEASIRALQYLRKSKAIS